MASPTSPRHRRDRPMAIRICPECGNPAAPSTFLDIAADLKLGDGPFQPWAKALLDQRADGSRSGEDSPANCLPRGVPRINASPLESDPKNRTSLGFSMN